MIVNLTNDIDHLMYEAMWNGNARVSSGLRSSIHDIHHLLMRPLIKSQRAINKSIISPADDGKNLIYFF